MSSLLCVSSHSTPFSNGRRENSKQQAPSSSSRSRCCKKMVSGKNKKKSKKLFGAAPVVMASKDDSSDSKTAVVAAASTRRSSSSSRVSLFFKKLRSFLRGRKLQLAASIAAAGSSADGNHSSPPRVAGDREVEAAESATAPPAPPASLDNIDQNHIEEEASVSGFDLHGHFGGGVEDSHHHHYDGGKTDDLEPTPEEAAEDQDIVDVDDDDDDDSSVPAKRKESFSYALEELEWGPEPVLEEWTIHSRELAHNRVVSSTKDETVYNGYWHGSVLVHCRSTGDRESVENFVSEVNTLCCIRHENIQLFLGVCFDYRKNYMSIVMDQKKGDSLHTLLHKHGHQFSNHSSMKILNQVAQGMEYLHSKGIPHHLLTSKSISVYRRACISMLSPHCPNGSVLPEHLPYLPPEVVRTLCVEQVNKYGKSDSSETSRLFAKESAEQQNNYCSPFAANVFSFGTLVYELALNELPYARDAVTSVIWKVGNGESQSLSRSIQHSSKLREIVHSCWTGNPSARPSFDELMSHLSHNTAHMSPRSPLLGRLHSPFSFSEPFRMANISFGL